MVKRKSSRALGLRLPDMSNNRNADITSTSWNKQEDLPGHVLQEQVCSECSQYLTVLPVIQKKNGEIICGRHGDAEVGVKSLLNTVMQNYSFRCANHFEGCHQILDTSTAKQHESECKVELHECLFCSFEGNWAQILQHSSIKHPLSVRRDCKVKFKIGTESSQKFLCPINETIFVFTVCITYEKFRLTIDAAAKNDFGIKDFVIKFSKYSDHKDDKTSLLEFISFDNRSKSYFEKDIEELIFQFGIVSLISCQVMFKTVNLSDRELVLEKKIALYNTQMQSLVDREKALVKSIVDHENSVVKSKSDTEQQQKVLNGLSNICKKLSSTLFKCCQCQTFVKKTLYFCPQNHCYCEKCLSNTCKLCNDICDFTKISDFDQIVVSCDWPLCKKSIDLASYVDHTSSCSHRPYKCPISNCPDVVFSIQGLIDHWHGSPLVTDRSIEFDKYGNYKQYWLIDNDLYCVMVKFSQTNLQISIDGGNTYIPTLKFESYSNYNASWSSFSGSNYSVGGKFMLIFNFNIYGGHYPTRVRVSLP